MVGPIDVLDEQNMNILIYKSFANLNIIASSAVANKNT
jgi:hypothetical protein